MHRCSNADGVAGNARLACPGSTGRRYACRTRARRRTAVAWRSRDRVHAVVMVRGCHNFRSVPDRSLLNVMICPVCIPKCSTT